VTVGLILLVGGAAAGLFGSLLGLGGGLLLVPLMTLAFGLPLREAVAVSLVAVVVTSSASTAVYLERHVANLRLGMTLELFSAIGALAGGLLAFMLEERVIAALFAVLLLWTAATMARRREPSGREPVPVSAGNGEKAPSDAAPEDGSFLDALSGPGYRVRRLLLGMAGSVVAGVNSALLGVGGGIIKVPLMHVGMGVPLRTSTATSNLMMGITAVSSAVIYAVHGEIDPFVAGPIALGVFVGASTGPRIAHRIPISVLRWVFVAVLVYTAFQMVSRVVSL
jgi:uncharacterized membrane protein YfcA